MSRLLIDWVDGYLEYTENSEPPYMFRLWSAISVIAGVLQRKCKFEWGALTFYPNMYNVLVGPPAARKGTAMDQARPFLEDLDIKMAAEATTREALIQTLKQANDRDGTIINGSPSMVLHSSLTIWAQELTVFLGYQNHQLMSDLTDWYDCRSHWTYRTKNMGTDEINGVFVNLFGATTPALVRTTLPLDAIGGGLTSRIIFIYEPNKGKVIPYPDIKPDALIVKDKLWEDLCQIHLIEGTFKATDKFLERYVKWYPEQEANPPFRDQRFEGYCERRANHMMKLCMILNASRSDERRIDVIDFDRAINILTQTERKMPRTFSGVGMNASAGLLESVMRDVYLDGEISFAELLRRHRDNADKWLMEKIMESLEAMKQVQRVVGDSAEGPVYRWIKNSDQDLIKGEEETDDTM